jgi:hypothetical protein
MRFFTLIFTVNLLVLFIADATHGVELKKEASAKVSAEAKGKVEVDKELSLKGEAEILGEGESDTATEAGGEDESTGQEETLDLLVDEPLTEIPPEEDSSEEEAPSTGDDELKLTITPAPETPEERRERIIAERRAKREARYESLRLAREKRHAQLVAKREQYWKTHKHPPAYFNWMPFGGAVIEDRDNRLTDRSGQVLQGVGAAIRAGGIVNDMHMIGIRIQGMARPSRRVLGPDGERADKWGAVVTPYIGPEYRFLTKFGLYVGGTLGGAGIVASRDGDCDEECWDDIYCDTSNCDDAETRGVMGLGGMLSLGYQYRIRRYFSMNIEMFGGFFRGFDTEDDTMNIGLFGVGIGLGV